MVKFKVGDLLLNINNIPVGLIVRIRNGKYSICWIRQGSVNGSYRAKTIENFFWVNNDER